MAPKKPLYDTPLGKAFHGDSVKILVSNVPDSSVDLIMTSPPYPLNSKKSYGNVSASEYVDWFQPFVKQFHRVLKETGSLVINLANTWNPGEPTRSLFAYELLLSLCKPQTDEEEPLFYLAQEFYWFNTAKIPNPAEWVTIKRIRVKDSVEPVWWLSKGKYPKANNKNVLEEYSESMKKLIERGTYNAGQRPSGWNVSEKTWLKDNGGAIPPNLLAIANTASNDAFRRALRRKKRPAHPAMFPEKLPEFFIQMLTEPGDLVIDPFCGSNTTGYVAESLERRWISIDIDKNFLVDSKERWETPPAVKLH